MKQQGTIHMNMSIRVEEERDYRSVEELTRETFWNLYVPGCDEHYLAHVMRKHADFIPELDFVVVHDNKIIGNIMFAKSQVVDAHDSSHTLPTITFGPVSVLPQFQKQGIGSALITHSIAQAKAYNYPAIIIQGHPHNYCKHGFRNGRTGSVYSVTIIINTIKMVSRTFHECATEITDRCPSTGADIIIIEQIGHILFFVIGAVIIAAVTTCHGITHIVTEFVSKNHFIMFIGANIFQVEEYE